MLAFNSSSLQQPYNQGTVLRATSTPPRAIPEAATLDEREAVLVNGELLLQSRLNLVSYDLGCDW